MVAAADGAAAAASEADEHVGPPWKLALKDAVRLSLKRTYDMFVGNVEIKRPEDTKAAELMLQIKINDEYAHLKDAPDQASHETVAGGGSYAALTAPSPTLAITGGEAGEASAGPGRPGEPQALGPSQPSAGTPGNLLPGMQTQGMSEAIVAMGGNATRNSQVLAVRNRPDIPKPVWHPPWKLMRVHSGHEGWVRSVKVDPTNEWFASCGNDRLIKIWDLASGTLKLSLTGHIMTVRDVAISDRHPYLFSASEDCEVKCWDLEQNMVVRNYHGHLSGVYNVTLHPTLNILATGGRDGTVRVWDMRTKHSIHVLSGHTAAISAVVAQASEPQFISGAMDRTVRLWDLVAGKSAVTLTNHKKSVRALALHPSEYTFVSCASDNNKVWKMPKGAFERNIAGSGSIVNTCVVRPGEKGSSILITAQDNGQLNFWDWRSGHKFQTYETIPQPGSLSSENGVFNMCLDMSGSRLLTAECDKTIKVYKEDPNATEESHPLQWKAPKASMSGKF